MKTRTIRDLTILLPGEDPADLEPLDAPPRDDEAIARRLITGQAWTRAHITSATLSGCWLINADLSAMVFESVTLDRCVLRGATLIGARLADVTLKNVIFENCRLDYATFHNTRTTGPTAFLGCSLTETTLEHCKLTQAAFDGCKLAGTTLDATDLRSADLRGNDLSTIAGITCLRGATVSEDQLPSITDALARDLELRIKAQV
ncbi:MAG: hypothetical protein GEU94_19535 [Micromonosporaceae bacterium]|nr:hypothetical protein [Micromonosporaceae bacterium]